MNRLSETVNREQFILWRDGLDEYLENSPGWQKATQVLEKVRSWTLEASPQRVADIVPGTELHGTVVKSEQLYC